MVKMNGIMKGFGQYQTEYIISQGASLIILLAAWKNTRIARGLFSLLFLWAAGVNMYSGLTKPDVYLEYADMALPFYKDFINGWFSRYNQIIIPLIAIGQLLIGMGMLLKGRWVQLACIGAIVFLLAIAPFLVGAAFPFSITVSVAAWLILKKDDRNYLWKRKEVIIVKHIP
jgi:hypothetical protein